MHPNPTTPLLPLLLALAGCGIQVGGSGCDEEAGREAVSELDVVPNGWALSLGEAFDRRDGLLPATGTLTLEGDTADVTQTLSVNDDAELVDLLPDVVDGNGCADIVVQTGTLRIESDLVTLEVDVDVTYDAFGEAPPDTTHTVGAATTLSRAEGEVLVPELPPPAGARTLTVSAWTDGDDWRGSIHWNDSEDGAGISWTAAP